MTSTLLSRTVPGRGEIDGYFARSSAGPELCGLTKMLTTTASQAKPGGSESTRDGPCKAPCWDKPDRHSSMQAAAPVGHGRSRADDLHAWGTLRRVTAGWARSVP